MIVLSEKEMTQLIKLKIKMKINLVKIDIFRIF